MNKLFLIAAEEVALATANATAGSHLHSPSGPDPKTIVALCRLALGRKATRAHVHQEIDRVPHELPELR